MKSAVAKSKEVWGGKRLKELKESAAKAKKEQEDYELFLECLKGLGRFGKNRYDNWSFIRFAPKSVAPGNAPVFEEKYEYLEDFADPEEVKHLEMINKDKSDYLQYHPVFTSPELIAKEVCPGCQQQVPLISYHEQMHDGYDGDVWRRRKFTLCISCELLTLLSKTY